MLTVSSPGAGMRWLLGMFEAGLFPGVNYYLSWYVRFRSGFFDWDAGSGRTWDVRSFGGVAMGFPGAFSSRSELPSPRRWIVNARFVTLRDVRTSDTQEQSMLRNDGTLCIAALERLPYADFTPVSRHRRNRSSLFFVLHTSRLPLLSSFRAGWVTNRGCGLLQLVQTV